MTATRSVVRLGLIGAGRWGRIYMQTIAALEGAVLARVASRNPETRALVDASCEITKDWRDVAEATDLDGVIIATPPALHAEMTRTAVAAGRAVMVEKPLTLDLDEARALKRFVMERSGFVMVDHIHLFHPAYLMLKETGLGLGPIREIAAVAGNWGPYRDDIPVLWDWGSHDVAMCLDLVGTLPETMSAERLDAQRNPAGFAENVVINLQFPGRINTTLRVGTLMDKTRRFAVRFEQAVLVFDDLAPAKLTRHGADAPIDAPAEQGEPMKVSKALPLSVAIGEFVDSIRDRTTDPGRLGLAVDVISVLSVCEVALVAASRA